MLLHRAIAALSALLGGSLLMISLGALWSHDPGWFFAPIESLLKPKDRANVAAVKHQLDDFGWKFTVFASAAAALWLSLARFLWRSELRAVAHHLVAVAFIQGTLSWSLFMPVLAESKSYRKFMAEVNRLVEPADRLYLHGRFNSDAVVFYRGGAIPKLNEPLESLVPRLGRGSEYVILREPRKPVQEFPAPMLKSSGRGPEGDATLLLMRAQLEDVRVSGN